MPEREFELYLSLLSRFLRLKPAQRDEISDELRDHLEARLDELAARGLSREQAIQAALDEFGDAAELAGHFTHLAQRRKRRLIMRCTAGTVAALVVGLLAVTAFWPGSPKAPLPVQVVGEDTKPAASTQTSPSTGSAQADDNARNAALQAILDRPIEVDFSDTPLDACLRYIKEYHTPQNLADHEAPPISIYIDLLGLEGMGLKVDVPVTLSLRGFKTRMILDLICEQVGIGYTTRDGLLYITSAAKADEAQDIRVYNVRDMIDPAAGIAGGIDPATAAAIAAQLGMGGMLAGTAPKSSAKTPAVAGSLADVISMMIAPDSWAGSATGASGRIVEYNGLLVVKNNRAVHDKVRKLLEMICQSLGEKAPVSGLF